MHNMHKLHMHNAVGGVYPNGNATYTATADILHGQPLMFDGGGVTPTTAATDPAIGIALDGAKAGDIVPVALLGNFTGTVMLRAAGAINPGGQIAANGTATGADTDVIIGRSLDLAATVGDMINVVHQVGQKK